MKKFDLPDEAMVITSTYVTRDGLPVLQVNHEVDESEEDWQFHCGNGDYSMDKMQLVRLSTILKIDHSLTEVADLPAGYIARRAAFDQPWAYLPKGESASAS